MTPATKVVKMRSLPRSVRPLARRALAAGWRITLTGRGHSRWTSPAGQSVVCSGSPSDSDNVVILARQLRRAGLALR